MWTFRAMNTDVTVAAPELREDAERELARSIEQLFRTTEQRFSRFRPDSELAQLNAADGAIAVSADMLALLVRARAHWLETRGIFEPAVGAAMRANGYDQTFAPGALDREDAPAATPLASIGMLEIDEERRRVTRPPHVQLDFGGFLKGLTVDRASTLTTTAVMVDAGGDATMRGDWIVEIEDPRDPARTIGSLEVCDQAVATSAANRRCWRRGAQTMHHLVDPRTNAPARTDIAQATVFASTAEHADVMAKVAFVLGADAAVRELERRHLDAVLVLHDGAIRTIGTVELHHA